MAHILVIDDDDTLRGAIVAFLQSSGHEVHEANDGKKALTLFEATPVDLVITDINMPEMDGIEIILKFGSTWPDIPVIAMSGGGLLPKEMLLDQAGLLGATQSISKPFDLLDLLEIVERALESQDAAGKADATRA